MEMIGSIWNTVIVWPMINSLVLLYGIFFNSFGLSIIIFTVLVRILMIPLTMKQSRQLKAMNALQPKLKELQAKFSKDRPRMSQETMKLYRENGVNPLGCLGPMFIQFPIWIGLYQALLQTLPSQPESLLNLSETLYAWLPIVHAVIPLNSSFLWFDLSVPDNTPILPILVGVSMFLMQKMTTMPSVDPKQASTNRMMLWMMPIMFGFFTLTFPTGLALYWVVSNIIGIVIQGGVTGWDPLINIVSFNKRHEETTTEDESVALTEEESATNERDRDNSQDSGRSRRNRPKGTGRSSQRGRNKRR